MAPSLYEKMGAAGPVPDKLSIGGMHILPRGPIYAVAGSSVKKLNDRHAFLEIATGGDMRICDVVEFGLSHPCTCLDQYAVIYAIGAEQAVIAALPSSFGCEAA